MASTLTAKWMWGDAGVNLALAKRNPFRWSDGRSIEHTIQDLEKHQLANPARPVKVEVQDGIESGVQRNFPDVSTALAGLQQYFSAPATDENSATDVKEEGQEPIGPNSACVLRQAFDSLLVGESTTTVRVRWMWKDAGLAETSQIMRKIVSNNPLRWSEWASLDAAMQALERLDAPEGKERPVWLHIKIEPSQGTSVRHETGAATPIAAKALLGEMLSIVTRLKDRGDFSSAEGQDNAELEYQKYALSTMQENGGCIDSLVRFTSTEGHPLVRSGQEGVIQKFDCIDKFLVNWGAHSASVSMQQCTLIATADRRRHLANASAEDVLLTLMSKSNDHLKMASEDPRQFDLTCKRITELYSLDPDSGFRANLCGMCNTMVEVMNRDMQQSNGPTQATQHRGCIMLWWIIHPRALQLQPVSWLRVEAAKTRALEGNVLTAMIKACEAFPQDKELVKHANATLQFLIKDSQEGRTLALEAGWKETE